MSDQTLTSEAQGPGKGLQPGPAGRAAIEENDQRIFELVCENIRRDGVTDGDAALLAGRDEEWLAELLGGYPELRRALKAARAMFRRDRLVEIRTSEKKGESDWRQQTWLLDHTEEAATELAKPLPIIDEARLAPNFIITPGHLRELHLRRAEALAKHDALNQPANE